MGGNACSSPPRGGRESALTSSLTGNLVVNTSICQRNELAQDPRTRDEDPRQDDHRKPARNLYLREDHATERIRAALTEMDSSTPASPSPKIHEFSPHSPGHTGSFSPVDVTYSPQRWAMVNTKRSLGSERRSCGLTCPRGDLNPHGPRTRRWRVLMWCSLSVELQRFQAAVDCGSTTAFRAMVALLLERRCVRRELPNRRSRQVVPPVPNRFSFGAFVEQALHVDALIVEEHSSKPG